MALHRRGGSFQCVGGAGGADGTIERIRRVRRGGTGPDPRLEADPALEGRREFGEQAGGQLLGGIGGRGVVDAPGGAMDRPVRAVRQGMGRAVAPERLPGAPPGLAAAVFREQRLRIRCFGCHLCFPHVLLHTTPCF